MQAVAPVCQAPLIPLLALAACGGPVAPASNVAVTVELAAADTLTFLGEERPLVVVARGPDGAAVTPSGLSWTSRAPSVAEVDASGTVRALANGDATIVVRAGSAADSIVVTVAQVASSVTITGPDTVFALGVHARLRASARDAGDNPYVLEPLTWGSADPATATVDAQGRVLPLAAGAVGIIARAGALQATHALVIEDAIPLDVDPALADSLQWALEDVSDAHGVVGVQGAVIVPGVGTWVGVHGRSGSTSVMRPDMALPVGSVAKTVISGLLLHLVDIGALGLDDRVGDLLPPFEHVTPEATVRQLLQNTSGIASFTSAPGFADNVLADRGRTWSPAELVETFVGAPEFAPGASWKSSNTGYLLAGMIAEGVTGQDLAALYAAELYGPLGLQAIFLRHSEPPRAAASETWNGPTGGPLENFTDLYDGPSFSTGTWPLGGLVVSAPTLAAWGEALFGDFLGPTVRAQMLAAVPDDGGIPNQVGAGVGVREFDFLGRTQWGHSGTSFNGSGMLLWDEASGVVVALAYNQNGPSHGASHFVLAPRLLRLALDAG